MPYADNRLVQIGGTVHDHRVLAAHLADNMLDVRLQIRRHARGVDDIQPDSLAAGEGNRRDARITDQRGTDGFALPGQEVQHVARDASLPEDLSHDRRDTRRLLGRFHDRGIAGNQRGGGHTGADRQREVPWADDDRDAAGLVEQVVALAEEVAMRLLGEQTRREPGVVVTKVNRLTNVGVSFFPRFAGFLEDDAGQLIATLPHLLGSLNHHVCTINRRSVAPGREGGQRRADGVLCLPGAGLIEDLWHLSVLDGFRKRVALIGLGEIAQGFIGKGFGLIDALDTCEQFDPHALRGGYVIFLFVC